MPDVQLLHGDCLALLRTLPTASVDACVTDPPAGIAFMGRDWDHDKGGRAAWVAWMTAVMTEVQRVLKPGGHAFVWALPRTAHWTATALEDAGFEIRDKVYHLFGSGFPKSLAVDKALDKAAGAERAVVGPRIRLGDQRSYPADNTHSLKCTSPGVGNITAPATDLAAQWAGWGTALKPAAEEWILARKPLAGTVVATVAAWGTGVLNIDASRVGTEKRVPGGLSRHSQMFGSNAETGQETGHNPNIGRWPPNVLLTHAPGCVPAGTRRVPSNERARKGIAGRPKFNGKYNNGAIYANGADQTSAAPDGTETAAAWICAPGCPVAALDAQAGPRKSGERKAGQGGTHAATFNFRSNVNANDFAASEGSASRFYPVFTPDPPAPDMGLDTSEHVEYNETNNTTVGGSIWASQDRNLSTLPASDTPPLRATIALLSGTPLPSLAGSCSDMCSCGSKPTAPSRPAIKSITVTTTSKTTAWKILNLSIVLPTSAFIAGVSCAMGFGGNRATSAANSSPSRPNTGTLTPPAILSTDGAAPAISAKLLPINNGGAPFRYQAKASRSERNKGCEHLPGGNRHETVKPQALMRWLCTLITPPGGTILDPFCGSGSTGVAAVTLGYRFIGCEEDAAYLAIAAARIAHAQAQQPAAVQPALLPEAACA